MRTKILMTAAAAFILTSAVSAPIAANAYPSGAIRHDAKAKDPVKSDAKMAKALAKDAKKSAKKAHKKAKLAAKKAEKAAKDTGGSAPAASQ